VVGRLHYSIAPSLRVAGFEDENDDEDGLSDVAFCARWLAVLSASEVGRTESPHEFTVSGLCPSGPRFCGQWRIGSNSGYAPC
jgi:hypothetical protein